MKTQNTEVEKSKSFERYVKLNFHNQEDVEITSNMVNDYGIPIVTEMEIYEELSNMEGYREFNRCSNEE